MKRLQREHAGAWVTFFAAYATDGRISTDLACDMADEATIRFAERFPPRRDSIENERIEETLADFPRALEALLESVTGLPAVENQIKAMIAAAKKALGEE